MDGLALSKIGQIAMNAQDLDRAIGFYRDVLGLKFLFRPPPAPSHREARGSGSVDGVFR